MRVPGGRLIRLQLAAGTVLLATRLLPRWFRRPARSEGDLSPLAPLPTIPGKSPTAPPLLHAAFRALDAAAVRWSLVRGDTQDIAGGARDIDLLVAEADWPRVAHCLAGLGFLRVPTYGRGSTGFYVGHDREAASWVRLDLATDLAWGGFSQFQSRAGGGCLDRSIRFDGLPSLDLDDAFWALVLHCVLAKGAVVQRHAARLQHLVESAREDGPMGSLVASLLPRGWSPETVRNVVRAGEWTRLLGLQRRMFLTLWQRDPLGTTARTIGRAVQRGLGYFRLAHRRWGLSVALLGPDGAGKTTLAAAIAADFGLPVRIVYMGLWAMRDQRGIGRIPGFLVVARPFTIWRKSIVAEYHRAHGRLVIFDRYTYDALVPPRGRLLFLKRPYFWFLAHAARAPTLNFLLDAPGELLFARSGEADAAKLERAGAAFRSLAGRIPGLQVIDARQSPEAIRAQVVEHIWGEYLAQGAVD